MGKFKIFIILILIILTALFVFFKYDTIKEYIIPQTFDEIALKYYDDTEFTDMNFYRENGIGRNSDKRKINELLNHFKALKYKRIDEEKLYSIRSDMGDLYINTNNYGYLKIEIYDEKYIVIGLSYTFKVEDKSKRLTKIKQNSEYVAYKIVGGKIDIDLIESIYNSMEIEKIN